MDTEAGDVKVYRCWWCSEDLPRKGKDCGKKECRKERRSGPWKRKREQRSE